jgi:CheY-like chemotaxis protein
MEGQAKPRILSSTTMRSSSDCSGSTSGWRASRSSEDRTRGYALGVYVTKPFDPSHLVEIVRRALAEKTAQA